jgi:arylsulfatase A-like enzyme
MMNRRNLLKLAGYGAVSTLAVGLPQYGAGAAERPSPDSPSFVVILVDDMGYGDIGPFGSKKNHTPNLDRMVAEGMKLTSFYGAPADQNKLVQRYTEEAVKFITTNRSRPFFLYLPHTAVHVPLHPGEAFKGKSANGIYGDCVEEVDWSVGRVLDALRELKLDEKTLVLFTSDNGPWLTQGKNGGVAGPLYGGKGTTWDGGVREPSIAWWPGRIAAGSFCDAVMSEMDVLPTLVTLAGGAVPQDRVVDGKDICPLLSGRSKESPHEALFYFNSNPLEAVRSGPWKMTIAPQGDGTGKKTPPVPASLEAPRLYNLDADIGETTAGHRGEDGRGPRHQRARSGRPTLRACRGSQTPVAAQHDRIRLISTPLWRCNGHWS